MDDCFRRRSVAARASQSDKACSANDVEHRLIKPRRPQTNGMAERFNGRISEIVAHTRFGSVLELKTAFIITAYHRSLLATCHPIWLSSNGSATTLNVFRKRLYNQTGLYVQRKGLTKL